MIDLDITELFEEIVKELPEGLETWELDNNTKEDAHLRLEMQKLRRKKKFDFVEQSVNYKRNFHLIRY